MKDQREKSVSLESLEMRVDLVLMVFLVLLD